MRNRLSILLALLALAAPGCSAYVIRGNVVVGSISDLTFVEPDDPRLAETGITNARVTVERDPDSLGAEVVARQLTDADGRFTLQLDQFGAGWMVEQWRIRAVAPGFRTADRKIHLSKHDQERRLLIILSPGASDYRDDTDLIEQYERFR